MSATFTDEQILHEGWENCFSCTECVRALESDEPYFPSNDYIAVEKGDEKKPAGVVRVDHWVGDVVSDAIYQQRWISIWVNKYHRCECKCLKLDLSPDAHEDDKKYWLPQRLTGNWLPQRLTGKPRCSQCMQTIEGAKRTKCGKCKRLFYCDRQCQTAHWNNHRPFCVAPKDKSTSSSSSSSSTPVVLSQPSQPLESKTVPSTHVVPFFDVPGRNKVKWTADCSRSGLLVCVKRPETTVSVFQTISSFLGLKDYLGLGASCWTFRHASRLVDCPNARIPTYRLSDLVKHYSSKNRSLGSLKRLVVLYSDTMLPPITTFVREKINERNEKEREYKRQHTPLRTNINPFRIINGSDHGKYFQYDRWGVPYPRSQEPSRPPLEPLPVLGQLTPDDYRSVRYEISLMLNQINLFTSLESLVLPIDIRWIWRQVLLPGLVNLGDLMLISGTEYKDFGDNKKKKETKKATNQEKEAEEAKKAIEVKKATLDISALPALRSLSLYHQTSLSHNEFIIEPASRLVSYEGALPLDSRNLMTALQRLTIPDELSCLLPLTISELRILPRVGSSSRWGRECLQRVADSFDNHLFKNLTYLDVSSVRFRNSMYANPYQAETELRKLFPCCTTIVVSPRLPGMTKAPPGHPWKLPPLPLTQKDKFTPADLSTFSTLKTMAWKPTNKYHLMDVLMPKKRPELYTKVFQCLNLVDLVSFMNTDTTTWKLACPFTRGCSSIALPLWACDKFDTHFKGTKWVPGFLSSPFDQDVLTSITVQGSSSAVVNLLQQSMFPNNGSLRELNFTGCSFQIIKGVINYLPLLTKLSIPSTKTPSSYTGDEWKSHSFHRLVNLTELDLTGQWVALDDVSSTLEKYTGCFCGPFISSDRKNQIQGVQLKSIVFSGGELLIAFRHRKRGDGDNHKLSTLFEMHPLPVTLTSITVKHDVDTGPGLILQWLIYQKLPRLQLLDMKDMYRPHEAVVYPSNFWAEFQAAYPKCKIISWQQPSLENIDKPRSMLRLLPVSILSRIFAFTEQKRWSRLCKIISWQQPSLKNIDYNKPRSILRLLPVSILSHIFAFTKQTRWPRLLACSRYMNAIGALPLSLPYWLKLDDIAISILYLRYPFNIPQVKSLDLRMVREGKRTSPFTLAAMHHHHQITRFIGLRKLRLTVDQLYLNVAAFSNPFDDGPAIVCRFSELRSLIFRPVNRTLAVSTSGSSHFDPRFTALTKLEHLDCHYFTGSYRAPMPLAPMNNIALPSSLRSYRGGIDWIEPSAFSSLTSVTVTVWPSLVALRRLLLHGNRIRKLTLTPIGRPGQLWRPHVHRTDDPDQWDMDIVYDEKEQPAYLPETLEHITFHHIYEDVTTLSAAVRPPPSPSFVDEGTVGFIIYLIRHANNKRLSSLKTIRFKDAILGGYKLDGLREAFPKAEIHLDNHDPNDLYHRTKKILISPLAKKE